MQMPCRLQRWVLIAGVAALALGPLGFVEIASAGPPSGACCLPDGGCEELLEFTCEETGGVFAGFDTTCDAVACDAPRAAPLLSLAGVIAVIGVLGAIGAYHLIFRHPQRR